MKSCIVCESKASLYCACDDAFLCAGCDQQVHSANAIAMRHKRVPICELCLSSPSQVYCKNDTAFLCSSCDESSHQGFMTRHERIPAQDAPSAAPSAVPALRAESEGDSHLLFQVPEMPMMVPPGVEDFPDWNDISGPLDTKALLGKDFSNDLDIFDADPSWLDRLDMGFDSLTNNMLEGVVPEFDNFDKDSSGKNSYANNLDFLDVQQHDDLPKSMPPMHVPVSQPEPTPLPDLYDPATHFDFSATPFVSEQPRQAAVKPMFAPERAAFRCETSNFDIASFVPPSLRPVDAHTLAERSLDRRMRLARYREKKKNRQFKKTIRYASRKAYAEVRPRIKGRFARKDEVVAMRAAGILPCA